MFVLTIENRYLRNSRWYTWLKCSSCIERTKQRIKTKVGSIYSVLYWCWSWAGSNEIIIKDISNTSLIGSIGIIIYRIFSLAYRLRKLQFVVWNTLSWFREFILDEFCIIFRANIVGISKYVHRSVQTRFWSHQSATIYVIFRYDNVRVRNMSFTWFSTICNRICALRGCRLRVIISDSRKYISWWWSDCWCSYCCSRWSCAVRLGSWNRHCIKRAITETLSLSSFGN